MDSNTDFIQNFSNKDAANFINSNPNFDFSLLQLYMNKNITNPQQPNNIEEENAVVPVFDISNNKITINCSNLNSNIDQISNEAFSNNRTSSITKKVDENNNLSIENINNNLSNINSNNIMEQIKISQQDLSSLFQNQQIPSDLFSNFLMLNNSMGNKLEEDVDISDLDLLVPNSVSNLSNISQQTNIPSETEKFSASLLSLLGVSDQFQVPDSSNNNNVINSMALQAIANNLQQGSLMEEINNNLNSELLEAKNRISQLEKKVVESSSNECTSPQPFPFSNLMNFSSTSSFINPSQNQIVPGNENQEQVLSPNSQVNLLNQLTNPNNPLSTILESIISKQEDMSIPFLSSLLPSLASLAALLSPQALQILQQPQQVPTNFAPCNSQIDADLSFSNVNQEQTSFKSKKGRKKLQPNSSIPKKLNKKKLSTSSEEVPNSLDETTEEKKKNKRKSGQPKQKKLKRMLSQSISESGEANVIKLDNPFEDDELFDDDEMDMDEDSQSMSIDSIKPMKPKIEKDRFAYIPKIELPKYTVIERAEKIEKYKQKRNSRCFSKKIRYQCRKKLADSRPRFKGRFASIKEPSTDQPSTDATKNIDSTQNSDLVQNTDPTQNLNQEEKIEISTNNFSPINNIEPINAMN